MKIWKLFSVLVLIVLLVAMLAACEGGSSGGTTQSGVQGDGAATSTPTADSATSTPTTAAPTSAPSTGGSQSTGGCTTAASCQKASVNVTPNQVKRGGKVTVTVKGWVANAKLQASIGVQAVDSDIVYATSDAQGNFSVILTINPQTTDTRNTMEYLFKFKYIFSVEILQQLLRAVNLLSPQITVMSILFVCCVECAAFCIPIPDWDAKGCL